MGRPERVGFDEMGGLAECLRVGGTARELVKWVRVGGWGQKKFPCSGNCTNR